MSERPTVLDAADHYAKRMAIFAAQQVQPGGIVLLGSSHFEWFDTDRFLSGYKIVNRGIASDRLGIGPRGILHRLDISVFECAPSFIILQNGINDIGELARTGTPPLEEILAYYEKVVIAIRSRLPEVPLCVASEMPTRGEFAACNPYIPRFNEHVAHTAEKFACGHVDLHAPVVDDSGELRADLTYDGLHLNEIGYALWAEKLRTVLPVLD